MSAHDVYYFVKLTCIIKHAEYKNKLAQIRTIYHQEIDKYEQACSEFTGHALKVLSRQNTIRPINQTEMDSQVARIEGEFSKVEHLLKKDTCASVMRLRNEFLDARSPYQFTSDLGASDEAFCTTSMRHIISQAAEGYNPQEMYQLMAEQRVSIVFDVS
ncbi:PBX4 [Bugula neritina]|uniref:PBX4 n=1 Tax=Bugula neritina TaxID=10212 RepID=A0A7J7J706_BUGNE|nr:PBX4 [Bugula neritina]